MISIIIKLLVKIVIWIVLPVILVKYVIWPMVKFLLTFLKWIIKTLPILIIIAILIPGILDEGVYLLVLLFLTVLDMVGGNDFISSCSEHFVINSKSGIAHHFLDSSADTIGLNHRIDIFATRSEIENMGYRIKKD